MYDIDREELIQELMYYNDKLEYYEAATLVDVILRKLGNEL